MTASASPGIGARLRRVRHQQRLSLADVEERSGGRWKAVVVGAYERGDRAVSITRLAELADFYGLPLAELLPGAQVEGAGEREGGVVLDLTALEASPEQALSVVTRYAEQIRRIRGDHNGRVLSLRATDVEMLALVTGSSPQVMIDLLRAEGALVPTSG
jgi:transcriptional regulator with XRE-family HTH domain